MTRRVQRSPVELAAERLAKMATDGTPPARMRRATYDTVERWKAEADSDIAGRWTSVLYASVMSELTTAQEEVDDVDASEPGAMKHARAVVRALRALGICWRPSWNR